FPDAGKAFDSAPRPVFENVQCFFNDTNIHPNQWTPNNYAQHNTTTDLQQYTHSLKKIRRTNCAVSVFAKKILEWMCDRNNQPILNQAQQVLAKKMNAKDEPKTEPVEVKMEYNKLERPISTKPQKKLKVDTTSDCGHPDRETNHGGSCEFEDEMVVVDDEDKDEFYSEDHHIDSSLFDMSVYADETLSRLRPELQAYSRLCKETLVAICTSKELQDVVSEARGLQAQLSKHLTAIRETEEEVAELTTAESKKRKLMDEDEIEYVIEY
ncbi:hypothetical protein BGZ83_012139, partial [Gryganskiella cystojenkinii]